MRVNLTEEAPVGDGVEIDEDVRVGAFGGEGAGALDKRVAASIGVGVDEDELARCFGERSEERVGFGIGIAQDGDGVPCGENAWRGEFEAEAFFECGAVDEF